jgi:hypothetical protein
MGSSSKVSRKPWDEMLAQAKAMGKHPYLDVGYPTGGKLNKAIRKGSGHKPWSTMTGQQSSTDVAYIMSVHEFGSKNGRIPARPFMRPAMKRNDHNIEALQAKVAFAVLRKELSLQAGLNLVGQYIANKIKDEIRNLKTPLLRPSTIKRKGGRTNLLDDTGQALNSVTWVTHAEGGKGSGQGSVLVGGGQGGSLPSGQGNRGTPGGKRAVQSGVISGKRVRGVRITDIYKRIIAQTRGKSGV